MSIKNFDLPEVIKVNERTLKGLNPKHNAVFEILDPKNLYFDTNEAKMTLCNFDLSEVKI